MEISNDIGFYQRCHLIRAQPNLSRANRPSATLAAIGTAFEAESVEFITENGDGAEVRLARRGED